MLECLMIREDIEPDYVFDCSNIVNTSRVVVNCQFLDDLSKSVPHEIVHFILGVDVRASRIREIWFSWWNTILINYAISQVAYNIVEDKWWSHIIWQIRYFTSSDSSESFNSKIFEVFTLWIQFKDFLSTNFVFSPAYALF